MWDTLHRDTPGSVILSEAKDLLVTYDGFLRFGRAWGTPLAALLAAITTAVLTWHFNRQQHRREVEKLRRALYDRRFAVWQDAKELWRVIYESKGLIRAEDISPQVNSLFAGIESARLLFTDDALLSCVDRYLRECAELLDRSNGFWGARHDQDLNKDLEFKKLRKAHVDRVLALKNLRDSLLNEMQRVMRPKETFQ